MATVRCADCGFLAARELHTRNLTEVERDVRKTWAIPKSVAINNTKWHDEIPLCFAQAADLGQEIGSFSVPAVLRVINEDRECGAFTPWQHGLTPREHAEMVHLRQLEQLAEERKRADEERAEQRRREDQRGRDELLARQQAWQAAENWKTRQLTVVIAILGAALTVVGYFLGKASH